MAGWPERGVRFLTEARAASALGLGSLGIKRPGREADNSASCSIEVTDAWRCSYALLEILVAWCSDELRYAAALPKFGFLRF